MQWILAIFRTQTVMGARADAERIKLIGSSEAAAIEAVGNAEAERMRLKASAYKQYGDAAMLSLVLETLPKVSIINSLQAVFKIGHFIANRVKSKASWAFHQVTTILLSFHICQFIAAHMKILDWQMKSTGRSPSNKLQIHQGPVSLRLMTSQSKDILNDSWK